MKTKLVVGLGLMLVVITFVYGVSAQEREPPVRGGKDSSAGDPARGAQVFRACAACHSLTPGEHLTGPSLANVYGRRAGTAEDFGRYSEALRKAGITWNEKTLDGFLADPQAFIPGNAMTFPGIRDSEQRAHLIAFLKTGGMARVDSPRSRMGGMMRAPRLSSLRVLEPPEQVKALRYCKDSYFVTLGTGETVAFWEFNLRFKTDSSAQGPAPGKPALVGAGMMGDRAAIVFARPEEIGSFIERRCE